MATEWGIFTDEGMIEGEFFSREAADAACAKYEIDDGACVDEVCEEHRDQRRETCEECAYPATPEEE